ncbi:hypothetical protein ACFRLW_15730 [Streptomyces sp. NPDC056728]
MPEAVKTPATETAPTETSVEAASVEETQTPSTESGPDGTPDPAGTADLGDAGKKALDAMKARWKTERDARRKLEEERDARATPKPSGDTDQADAAEIKRQATRDANAKANARIIKSEIRAAAAGKLADPSDALAHLDLKSFEVDDNGDVDAQELADAIEDLLTRKPYLAAKAVSRFQGTGDGGAARKASGPSQLTREDLKRLSPAAINKARLDGRLNKVLGITT